MGLETSALRITASTQAVICARIWKVTWRWSQSSFETSVRLHRRGFESSAFRRESERWLVGGPLGKRRGPARGWGSCPPLSAVLERHLARGCQPVCYDSCTFRSPLLFALVRRGPDGGARVGQSRHRFGGSLRSVASDAPADRSCRGSCRDGDDRDALDSLQCKGANRTDVGAVLESRSRDQRQAFGEPPKLTQTLSA